MDLKQKWVDLKSFVIECRRVLRVTRKPTKDEYKTIVKASALGMAIIGAMGFLIHILRQLLFPFIRYVKMEEEKQAQVYVLRTTANREDQVMDFVVSNARRKKLEVYAVIRPHGMRGYILVEAGSRSDAEQAAFNVPYARGILAAPTEYKEIEHMLEQVKHEMNIQKSDIVEIISGPFKRENAKVTRIDKQKEEVVVELLQSAVPIPITVKMDAVKVIRRESEEEIDEKDEDED